MYIYIYIFIYLNTYLYLFIGLYMLVANGYVHNYMCNIYTFVHLYTQGWI